MVQSILASASRDEIQLEPYPHLVVNDALDPEYYEQLANSFPDAEFVAGGAPLENNAAYLRSAIDVIDNPRVPEIWREFFAFHTSTEYFQQVVSLWGDLIYELNPSLEANFGKSLRDFSVGIRNPGKRKSQDNRQHDVVMVCEFGINSAVDVPGSVRLPHVDNPAKIGSALLYFRDPGDESSGGEYELYRIRERMFPKTKSKNIPVKYLEKVETVPYKANTLLTWVNSAGSVHGVSPRSVTPIPRRYIAVAAECYSGHAPGYFGQHEAWEGPVSRLRIRLGI